MNEATEAEVVDTATVMIDQGVQEKQNQAQMFWQMRFRSLLLSIEAYCNSVSYWDLEVSKMARSKSSKFTDSIKLSAKRRLEDTKVGLRRAEDEIVDFVQKNPYPQA